MTTKKDLTVCIVCSDRVREIRITKWENILKPKFSNVYIISSEDDRDDKIPEYVNVVLLHASDADGLWSKINIETDEIFQFTSDGNPWAEDFGWSILRETREEFEIQNSDIDELIEFISGFRCKLPSMCILKQEEIGNFFDYKRVFGNEEIRTNKARQIAKRRLINFLKLQE